MTKKNPVVGIIMGSESDWPVMIEATKILESFDIPYSVEVVSAHRTPKRMYEYAENAYANNLRVIIAGAGGAAHLPGMVASITNLPVIGVPILTKSLSGVDSLLSIVQMPKGIPVATVAINNAENAGLLAIRILSTSNQEIYNKLLSYQQSLVTKVAEMNIKIQK